MRLLSDDGGRDEAIAERSTEDFQEPSQARVPGRAEEDECRGASWGKHLGRRADDLRRILQVGQQPGADHEVDGALGPSKSGGIPERQPDPGVAFRPPSSPLQHLGAGIDAQIGPKVRGTPQEPLQVDSGPRRELGNSGLGPDAFPEQAIEVSEPRKASGDAPMWRDMATNCDTLPHGLRPAGGRSIQP